jgi:hypothetical protein
MRAFLIDSERRAITEINLTPDFESICSLLDCKSFTNCSRPFNGSLAEGFDGLYASDDFIEDREESRFWFTVDADRDPPSSFPICGRGLVRGVDKDGDICDARISAAELASRITFTQRKFKGYDVTSFASLDGDGGVLGRPACCVHVGAIAPIVDGTNEVQS